MFARHKDPHPSVYLLADHLDAILAAGEDLAALRLDLSPFVTPHKSRGTATRDRLVATFIARATELEWSLAAHLRQARIHGKEVAGADHRFASLIRLFLGGTAVINDTLAEYAAPDMKTFEHGNDPTAFLRARKLIDSEAGSLDNLHSIAPGEDMLVSGRIELGPLLDLVSAFLDSLDLAYDLYPNLPDALPRKTEAGTVSTPQAATITAAATAAPRSLSEALKSID